MKKTNIFFLFFLLLFLTSCKDESIPPKPDAILTLTLEDVSCTEAWLTLSTTNLRLPTSLNLLKDDNFIKTINLETSDTLLYIDSLLPNQTYNFQLTSIQNPVSSNQLSVTTMDTTSHNFTFETFEFGTIGSSVLFDVAIINENDIWAVGEIMIADTSANGYTTYNAVHWDGNEWELKRILFPTVCGSSNLTSYSAKSIFVFENGQIWISSSGDKIAILQDGTQISQYCLPSNVSMSINKMWGISSNDLYAVGNGGNIAHYNGSQWTKIESGTTLNINDIWGDYNQKTGEWEILAVASNILQSYEKEVLSLNNSSVEKLSKDGIDWTLGSIWFKTNQKYFVVGSGIYKKNSLTETRWIDDSENRITQYHVNRIRANDINDLFIGGAYGETLHFNGYSWKSFISETFLSNGTYLSVDVENNLIVSVGYQSARAVITIGKRTN